MTSMAPVDITLDAVIVVVTEETPKILCVEGPNEVLGVPSGALTAEDRTLQLAMRRVVQSQTGLEVGYVEQLYSFGDADRDPGRESRLLSVAYLALAQEERPLGSAQWRDFYELLPWEDHREGQPDVVTSLITPALHEWMNNAADADEYDQRTERAQIVFGLGGAPWDGVRVLERYELLYEVGLLSEGTDDGEVVPSLPLRLDHRRIAASALGRLRGKLTYRPLVFELLPSSFTLFQLQRLVEALAGVRLHKQNFRRLVESGGLVEPTGASARTGGRPAALFRFRREVLRERPRPGVGTPWSRL